MKAPWFPFFTADWIVGVTSLSAAERGVYVSLLALMYDRNGPLVRDDGRLSRQCGLPKAGFVRALDGLIATGKILFEEGCLFNLRARAELAERNERKSQAQNGGLAKWASGSPDKRKRSERLSAAREKATHSRQEWEAMLFAFPTCVRCGSGEQIVKDHIVPIYQGGTDGIDNLQPLCMKCNVSKGPESVDHRPSDWRAHFDEKLKEIMRRMPTEMPAERLLRARALQSQSERKKEEERVVGAKAPETPLGILEAVLSAEVAAGVIDHRRKLRKPLTVMAAKGLAREFRETGDPDLAARTMVVQGWQGFRRDWFDRVQQKGSGNGRNGKQTIQDTINFARDRIGEMSSGSSPELFGGAVLRLPST